MTGNPLARAQRLCVMALLAICLCPVSAMAQAPWGYELPDFGSDTVITALYRSQAGAIVLGFSHGPRNARQADFYDTGLNRRLAPEQAVDARSPAQERQRLAELHLTPISGHAELTNAAGTQFGMEDLSSSRCLWPYDAALTITGPAPNGHLRDYLVVWKLPQAEEQSFGCRDDTPLNAGPLRLRFHGEAPQYYRDAGPDVFAVFARRYLVRFDAGGETHFFDHRKDAALIRAAAIMPLVRKMDGVRSLREAQTLVNRIEAIIAAGFRA